MIHLGDITKINGATAPIVDCVIGGSPCAEKEPLVQILAEQKRQEDWRIVEMPGNIEQEG